MNTQQIRREAQALKEEDARDVRHIINGFRNEGATTDQLKRALAHAENYETRHGGSRGNRNMITAIQQLLASPTFFSA